MEHSRRGEREFWIGLGRAFGGAILFSFPLLMTMEMWWLGFYVDSLKLLMVVLLIVPVLVGISYYSGFEAADRLRDNAADGVTALAVGLITAGFFLTLFGVLSINTPLHEVIGKIALLSVPAGIGAALASKQFGQGAATSNRQKKRASYWGELFMMCVGALFIGFNVAPTEEMVLIAYKMTPWHAVLLVAVSLVIMHAVVFSVGFRGQEQGSKNQSFWKLFRDFTLVGYVIALLVSAYLLWTFERLSGQALLPAVMTVLVLSFPGALGAAVSRVII